MSDTNTENALPGFELSAVDALQQEKSQPEQATEQVTETPKMSAIEEQARAAGWKPKSEFQGDAEEFVSAGEFLRRGQLFDKIHTQNKEIREMKRLMNELAAHNAKVEVAGYERAIQELKAAKKLALDDNNTSAVVELDERIAATREQIREEKAKTQVQQLNEVPPEYIDFANANPWYTKDRAMTAFADAYGKELISRQVPIEQVYKAVAQEVRKEFAHKFQRPTAQAAVEAPRGNAKANDTAKFQPTQAERIFARDMVKYGIFKTESDYYAQLRATRK